METIFEVGSVLLLAAAACLSAWYWRRYRPARSAKESRQEELEQDVGAW